MCKCSLGLEPEIKYIYLQYNTTLKTKYITSKYRLHFPTNPTYLYRSRLLFYHSTGLCTADVFRLHLPSRLGDRRPGSRRTPSVPRGTRSGDRWERTPTRTRTDPGSWGNRSARRARPCCERRPTPTFHGATNWLSYEITSRNTILAARHILVSWKKYGCLCINLFFSKHSWR